MNINAAGFIQKLYLSVVEKLSWNMGLGSGGEVDSSGEEIHSYLLKDFCETPYVIFDVGANQGKYIEMICSNLNNKDYKIHAFEPSNNAFKQLEKNLMRKNLSEIKLNNYGLGRENGSAILYYDKPGSGLASLTKRKLVHFNIDFRYNENIEIDTIDNYVFRHNIDKIDLLKIDVEGHELDVLEGASDFLKKNVEFISFEFGGCNIDTRTFFQDFYYLFKNYDMSLYRILPRGKIYRIDSYKEIYEHFRTTNYIATRLLPL